MGDSVDAVAFVVIVAGFSWYHRSKRVAIPPKAEFAPSDHTKSLTTSDWEVRVILKESGPSVVKAVFKKDTSVEYSYPLAYVNGVGYSPWCPQKRWDALNQSIKYRDSDVLVVTYPKCGTTWAEQAVLLLLNGGNSQLLNPATKNTYHPQHQKIGKIWPEACVDQDSGVSQRMKMEFETLSHGDFDSAPAPRVIKSHAPLSHLLASGGNGLDKLPSGLKIVVVSRNLLDACVSSYYHAFNPFKSGWPFAAWASVWLSGNVPHGSWFDWNKNWFSYSLQHPSRIHWVQYEDLKADPVAVTKALAAFLGGDISDEVIQMTVDQSSFDSMKKQATENGGDTIGHLRKGVSGDWKNHFSEQLAAEYVDKFRAECAGSGLVFSLGAGTAPISAP